MENNIKADRQKLKELFDKVIATDSKAKAFSLDETLKNAISMILERVKAGGKLFFIGNGGSASIASHMATDFMKNAHIPAMAFNDSSVLTCISNDLGYEHVFEKPLELLVKPGDILIAISSSGKSENILLGVKKSKEKQAKIITLSGFDENNPLRKLGELNFYVPSKSYGNVEIMHLSLCHSIVDVIVNRGSHE